MGNQHHRHNLHSIIVDMEEDVSDLKYTVIDRDELGTLWRCHIASAGHIALEYIDGPWLLSRFTIGTKVRVGSREERNGRNWYETPIVAKVISIKRINPTEARVTFNCLNGSMWALDVSPDTIHNDSSLGDIIDAVDAYRLDDLYFLNKSYDNGELI